MEEKFLEVNGIKTFTRITGEGSPFLILHGWGGGISSWIYVQDELSKYFKVITFDLPGFGKSDLPPSAWNMGDYIQFILDFIKKIGINDFYLLGHSFGASLAIKLSVQSPEKIRKLILVDSAGRRPKKSFAKKALASASSIFKIFSALPGYNTFRRFFYRFILRNTDYAKATGVMKEIFKKVIAEDLLYLWERINLKTLIIWGKKDEITPIKDAFLMKEKISNSELKILNCDHNPHHQMPDILVKTILDFVKK